MWIYVPFLVNFHIWPEVGVQIHTPGAIYPTAPAPFVKSLFFSIEVSWHPSQKSIDDKFKGLFLAFQLFH